MTTPGWMIDELAHAGDEHLDPDYVTGYDRKSGTDHTGDLDLLRAHRLDETSTVVDLGAGTGSFTLAVAPFCHRVVAVDVSPAMLTDLSAKVAQMGLTNVETVNAGFLSYEHQGAPANFVYSRNALHHLPDFWKALALKQVAGILKHGGTFLFHDLVYSFEPDETNTTIEAWLAGAADRPEDGWTRAELETHVREEYSTFSWLLEPMIEHAGFDIQQNIHRQSRIYTAYLCMKR